jgi:hypothetical protein
MVLLQSLLQWNPRGLLLTAERHALGEILSGWRDLNSRPLDPQAVQRRYPPCSYLLTGAWPSVNLWLALTSRDLPYPTLTLNAPETERSQNKII